MKPLNGIGVPPTHFVQSRPTLLKDTLAYRSLPISAGSPLIRTCEGGTPSPPKEGAFIVDKWETTTLTHLFVYTFP